MSKKDIRNINNKYLKKQIILVIVICLYVLSLSVVSARYVLKKIDTHLSASKEFYFYSDKLSDEENEYPIKWSGTEECIIPINLYTKLNNLKKANNDIKYEVEYELLSSNAICKLSKESGVVLGSENTDTFNISIIPNGILENDEKIYVKINVKTVDDFEKKLTATFAITLKEEEVLYEIQDNKGRPYFNFIVNNMNKGKITVEFDPNQIIVDTTNSVFLNLEQYEILENTKYINKFVFTIDPMTNKNIKFFKKDKSQDYTGNKNILNFKYEQI